MSTRDSADTATIAEAREAPATPMPGHTLGRYALLEELGAGGMGRVYRAYDPKLRREVALKLLKVVADGRAEARIVREAQAMAQLSHPNVLPVYDVESEDGRVFIAMEFVEGATLRQWVDARRGRWPAILEAYLAAGEGLAAAHRVGLIHRDFKPANVLVGNDGRVRVLDFGLVRLADDADVAPPSLPGDELGDAGIGSLGSRPDLTGVGTVMGSPPYMSPEQHADAELDPRSDQFSFCVALFEGLYGTRPFPQQDYAALATAKATGRVADVAPPRGLPRPIRTAIRRGLSTKPAARFESMDELLAALRSGAAAPRRRRIAIAGVAAIGVLSAAVALREDPQARCTAGAEVIGETWNDDVRRELASVFEGAGTTAAAPLWTRAAEAIDAWTQRWRAQHVDACVATHVHASQSADLLDRRMQCLSRRRLALAAVLDGWREGIGPESLGAAASTAARLPDPDRCGDLQALQAEVAPPEDPDVAREVETLRDRLATAEGLSLAARYDRAQRELVEITTRAEALGYRPLLARARLALGKVRSSVGDHAAASDTTRAAYFDAVAAGDDDVAAQASTLLVAYLGHDEVDAVAAAQWQAHARAWAEHLDQPSYRARLHEAIGTGLMTQSKFAEAHDEFVASYELRKREEDEDPLAVSLSLNNIGVSLMRLGRYAEAVDEYRRAEAIVVEVLGDDHPDVALSATNLGNALERLGRYDEAEVQLRRALHGFETTLGESHPNIAVVLTNLGNVLTSTNQHEQARPIFERALRVARESLGDAHPIVGTAHNNLGENLHARRELEQALAEHELGLRIRIDALGEDHPDVAASRANIGDVLADMGQYERARTELEAALKIRRDTRQDPRILAGNELQLARILWRSRQDPARAHTLATDALARFEAAESSDTGPDAARALLAEINEARAAPGSRPPTPSPSPP